MPRWTCASVPRKTSSIASPRQTTVSRSEARRRSGALKNVSGPRSEITFAGMSGKGQAPQKIRERIFLGSDQRIFAGHFHEPRSIALSEDRGKDAGLLRRLADGRFAHEIDDEKIMAIGFQMLGRLRERLLVDRVKA